jgi:hypothetical protein
LRTREKPIKEEKMGESRKQKRPKEKKGFTKASALP